MPRVMRVAAARQRYARVPTIDPATGQQKTITMNRTARKTGRQVVQRVTHEDRTKPLPPYRCDACADPIAVGTPYKYIDIKQTYGGTGKVESDDPEAAEEDCAECDGTGLVTPDEPTEDQIDEWREAVEGEIQNVMDNAPV